MTPLSDDEKNVEEKIDATKYFFTKMKENYSEELFFRYNFEAFLCIAHSARENLFKLNTQWFNEQTIASSGEGQLKLWVKSF